MIMTQKEHIMATIHSEDIIKELLENNGVYMGDPPVMKVYIYRHEQGHLCYAIFYAHEHDDIAISPAVRQFLLLFSDGFLTPDGVEWLHVYNNLNGGND